MAESDDGDHAAAAAARARKHVGGEHPAPQLGRRGLARTLQTALRCRGGRRLAAAGGRQRAEFRACLLAGPNTLDELVAGFDDGDQLGFLALTVHRARLAAAARAGSIGIVKRERLRTTGSSGCGVGPVFDRGARSFSAHCSARFFCSASARAIASSATFVLAWSISS
jgi:hypothetical protein